MSNLELIDAAARKAAIEDHSQSIFIDAGAGTGKTETIVKRIVNRLLNDDAVHMMNVAAITFTDKAGAELRNRFRKVLREVQEVDGKPLDKAQADLISEYVHQVDSAAIGTIHSFCKRILTDYSIAAKLPVGFAVSSEDAGPSLKGERVKRVTEKAWESLSNDEEAILRENEISIRKMRDLVGELDGKFARLAAVEVKVSEAAPDWEIISYKFIQNAIEGLRAEQVSRRNKGSIEFDDLLMFTRDLLRDESELRMLVANTYKLLVVDEFQDTDPIQWDIIQMVVSPEKIQEPKPGSLVLVGDPKQSIYRFRNADIHTFIKVKELFSGSGSFGSVHELKSNFRTVNPIIDFVNKVFVDEIAATENPLHMGIEYNGLEIVHSPDISNPGPPVVVIRNPEPIAGLVEHEFRQVAAEILRAINEGYAITKRVDGGKRVYDESRRARFGDVCILIPVRTHIGKLARALDALNIPYRSADPGILFDLPLIVGLINTFKVVALTDDDLALMAALKSPIFGLTDNQLHEYITVQGATWSTEGGAIGDCPVAQALNTIYEIRKASGLARPSQTLKMILERREIFESLIADRNGAFEASALRMIITHAYNWENQGNVGLLDYVNALEVLMDENSRISLPLPAELNSDAVQIMTIHAAKGLEFPITVVAGLASQKKNSPETLLISRSGNIQFNLGKNSSEKAIESSGYGELAQGEMKLEQKQEENRLMYVAMTRAQDHLIVSAVGEPSGGKVPRSRQLIESLAAFAESSIELPFEDSAFPQLEPFDGNKSRESGLDYVAEMNMDYSEQIAASSLRRVVSPSSDGATDMKVFAKIKLPGLVKPKETSDFRVEDVDASASSLIMRQRDGRPFGRALHGIMDQIIQYGAVPDAELLLEFINSKAVEENAVEFIGDLERRVSLLLSSEIVLEALASEERYPELHLAIADPNDDIKVAEGFADLVYKSPKGGYVLVDYKTDKEILGEQLLHYSQQLGAYAIILEELTGQKPERILLLHAKPDSVATIPL
jgi:ATP-dependent helicase/nuclease subunit A